MREELAKVNLELNKQKRLVARYKGPSKENSYPATPLPSKVGATPFRRQTIASPLSNRNGQR